MRHLPRLVSLLVGAGVAGVLAAGCNEDDGRQLPLPDPATSTTTVPSLDTAGDGVIEVFTVQSDAFGEGSPIPARHTCDGDDVAPALSWASPPPGAAEYVVVVRDLSAEGLVHWVVAGIDPAVRGFGEGQLPEGAVETVNQAGALGWSGPCPPPGTGPHVYELVVHAMPEPLGVDHGAPGAEVASLAEQGAIESAVLTGTYER